VAASSFDMTITDPKPLLDAIDLAKLQEILGRKALLLPGLKYVEPGIGQESNSSGTPKAPSRGTLSDAQLPTRAAEDNAPESLKGSSKIIKGRIQRLGDFIDTDALAPNEAIVRHMAPEELGTYCLKYTHPDFRRRAKGEGMNIVVAGKAFGVGSSRENAVTALQGTGIQAVIAKSFAFIYGRNQPNLGLLGFVIDNDEFYRLAEEGAEIEIDVTGRSVTVGAKSFQFQLSELEWQLVRQGGMTPAFRKWGKGLLEIMTGTTPGRRDEFGMSDGKEAAEVQW